MSFWGKLAKIGSIAGSGLATAFTGGAASPLLIAALGAGGAAAGAAANSMAKNRGEKLGASQEQDRINTLRGVEDRNSQGDAWKRLLQAQYVQNHNTGYTPGMTALGQLPTFGTAPSMGSTPDMKTGAAGMQAEAMRRLVGGSQLPPVTDVNQLSKQGVFEKILGIAAPIATGAGQFLNRPGQLPTRPGTPPYVAPPQRPANPWDNISFGG